jgi:signal transduction histidine kinase
VTDTGCGISADKTDLIFEAFQQAEGAVNRPYEGTGMGLSIANTLVEMMSGKIWLEENRENRCNRACGFCWWKTILRT